MRRESILSRIVPWLLCLMMIPVSHVRAEDTWQMDLSAYHSAGTYGTGSTTTITSVPLSIRRLFADGDITLIIPYVSITGVCSVTLINGVPNRTGGTCPTRIVTTTKGPQVTRILNARVTESGIGDLLLRGRYYILDEQGVVPTVALTARVKFPTADPDRGLGTGEFDEGVGVEISKRLTDAWIAFLDGSYTRLGSPPGVTFRDQWNYDVGVGHYFTKALLGSVYYEYWSPVVGGFQGPQDLLITVNYKATAAVRLNASVAPGLSDGSPDWALTAGLSVRF